MTVWATIVLSLFATTLSTRSGQALSLSQRLIGELQSSLEVSAALHYAGARLAEDESDAYDTPSDSWREAGEFQLETVRGEPLSVHWRLIDEESKVPLNTAPPEVLREFFEYAADVGTLEAEALADAVIDWRDEDSDLSPHGAESYSYHAYPCKNAPLQNIEELLLIKGFTPAIYSRVAPYATVTSNGRLNLNTIGIAGIYALGLTEAGTNGFMTFRSGPDNILGTMDDRVFIGAAGVVSDLEKYISVEDIALLAKLEKKGFLAVKSQTFTLEGKVTADDGRSTVMEFHCILDRDGNVMAWGEG